MKNNQLFILLLVNLFFSVSCVTTKKTSQKTTNFYTVTEIEQYIRERFLQVNDSLKMGDIYIVLDGVPRSIERDTTDTYSFNTQLKKYDKKDIRSINYLNARKLQIGCRPINYDILLLIVTNETKQKREAKKERLTWLKDRYFGEHRTVNNRPLVILNRKPLTTKMAFQLLQTLKVGHIDFIYKYEESQVIAGFEHVSKNGVVEIFTK